MFVRRRVRVKSRRPFRSLAAFALVTGGIVAVTMGPKPVFTDVWVEPRLGGDLDAWLIEEERQVEALDPSEYKGITWYRGERSRTPYSVVYIHGFSADRHEMDPVVQHVGEALEANVFHTRLTGHATGPAGLGTATVESWLEDTVEALAIGETIGERVIVVGTSTGGTLATWMAAKEEARGRLAALVLVSPNYQPKNKLARLPLYPWGEQIGRLVIGEERCWEPSNEEQARHWTTCYPTPSIVTMMTLVEHVRLADLSSIEVPTLVLYNPDDEVVDQGETLRVLTGMTGTDPHAIVVEGVTDRSKHVLAGDILSPGTNDEVVRRIVDFVRDGVPLPRSEGR